MEMILIFLLQLLALRIDPQKHDNAEHINISFSVSASNSAFYVKVNKTYCLQVWLVYILMYIHTVSIIIQACGD